MNRPNAIVVGSEISPSFLGLVRRAFELCSERELSLTAVIVSSTEPVDAGQLIYAGADRLARIALSVQDINAPVAAAESISQYALSEKPEFILFESSSFFLLCRSDDGREAQLRHNSGLHGAQLGGTRHIAPDPACLRRQKARSYRKYVHPGPCNRAQGRIQALFFRKHAKSGHASHPLLRGKAYLDADPYY